eukprot:1177574-Prorocentrum_minimum.AAC.5
MRRRCSLVPGLARSSCRVAGSPCRGRGCGSRRGRARAGARRSGGPPAPPGSPASACPRTCSSPPPAPSPRCPSRPAPAAASAWCDVYVTLQLGSLTVV